MTQVAINFIRIGRSPAVYHETLLDENDTRLVTISYPDEPVSRAWCQSAWWPGGLIPQGILVSSVQKIHFYNQWFSIMTLRDQAGSLLGHYCDINRPLKKIDGEYYIEDLMLDVWIAPDGTWKELDWDELYAAAAAGLIDHPTKQQAERSLSQLTALIQSGRFHKEFLDPFSP